MNNPTEYLPRSYHTRVSTYWWLARWAYVKFILREASSVFVAWIVVVTLLQIRALTRGPADYAELQNSLRSPLLLTLNAVSLAFVIFHAVTWFNLADRKSTRLNSSHGYISYAVFCLKKKNKRHPVYRHVES